MLGRGYRTYVFEDSGSVRRIPMTGFNRAWDGEPEKTLARYAGKRIRSAMVFLDLADREAMTISHVDTFEFSIGPSGEIDPDDMDKHQHEAINRVSYDEAPGPLPPLGWVPTSLEQKKLREAIFSVM